MKTSCALVAACAAASPMANATSTCMQTPTPQRMSGASNRYYVGEVSSLTTCNQRCQERNCTGFTWDASDEYFPCIVYDWISTAFNTNDAVSSWRCRSQLPPTNGEFPGLDIATVSATSADECSYKCEATLSCYAYSWSSTNGGSCTLKNDKPSAVVGPFDGSVVSGEVYKYGRPYLGSDLKGTDFGSAPGSQWTACGPICRRTSGCEGFSWSIDNGGTCWLKTKVSLSQIVTKAGTTSALMLGRVPVAGQSPCTETDKPLIFAGKTQTYNTAETLADCEEMCLSTNCAAFTFFSGCTLTEWAGFAVASGTYDGFSATSYRCRRQLPQENSDYAGLTIATTATNDPDGCSYKCDSTTNCWAYSWTKANNGTCTLKSNKPTTVSAPFDGSVVSGESYKCTEPQFDLDVVGVDLTSVPRAAWSDCCGICRRTAGCEAFSWSSYSGGTCWLKTKVTRLKMKRAPGVVSAFIFDPKPTCTQSKGRLVGTRARLEDMNSKEDCQQLCLFTNCVGFSWEESPERRSCRLLSSVFLTEDKPLPNVEDWWCRPQLPQENGDYYGSDLKNVPAVNAAACSYACEETSACYAYTWAKGVCYMKSKKPSTISGPFDGSVVSGEPLRVRWVYDNFDIVGNDLSSVQRGTWIDCVAVCRSTSGCESFSWSSYNSGTCWLKTLSSVSQTNMKLVLGVVSVDM